MRKLFLPLLVLITLAACRGGPAPTATPAPTLGIPQLVVTEGPTPTRVTQATVAPGTLVPTPTQVIVDDPLSGVLPFQPTGQEIAAVESGVATYSGYRCIIAAQAGCSCETPIVQQARFTFTESGQLLFRFREPGIDAEWVLNRLGLNQWDHTIALENDEGEEEGSLKTLITFTDGGYTFSQVAQLVANYGPNDEAVQLTTVSSDGFIRCPDVTYRRLGGEEVETPAP